MAKCRHIEFDRSDRELWAMSKWCPRHPNERVMDTDDRAVKWRLSEVSFRDHLEHRLRMARRRTLE